MKNWDIKAREKLHFYATRKLKKCIRKVLISRLRLRQSQTLVWVKLKPQPYLWRSKCVWWGSEGSKNINIILRND